MKIFIVILLVVCMVYAGGQPPSGCYYPSQCNPGGPVAAATLAEQENSTTLSEDEEVVEEALVQFRGATGVIEWIETPPTGIVDHPQGCIGGCVSLTRNERTSVFSSCRQGYIFFSKVNGQCPTIGDIVGNEQNFAQAVEACRTVSHCQPVGVGINSPSSLEMFGSVMFTMVGGRAHYVGLRAQLLPGGTGFTFKSTESNHEDTVRLTPLHVNRV